MIDEPASLTRARAPSKPRGPRKLDRGELDQTVGFVLRRALVRADQQFAEVMSELGITAGRYAMLIVIEHNPGCRMSDLSASIGISPNNMVPMVDSLLGSGFVVRTASDHDRRAKRLSLTEVGRRHLAQLRQRHQAITGADQARMGRANLDRLIELLWMLSGDRDA